MTDEPSTPEAARELAELRARVAEAALRESEGHFVAMFEVASIGMAQADPHSGRLVRVNQKMCAITGYSAAELLRMRVSELTHPDDRQQDGEAFGRVVRGETPDYHMEKRYVRKDGAVVWVNANMTVIRDSAGQPVRTMATIEDITERKRAELRIEALSKLGQRLSAARSPAEAARTIYASADLFWKWDCGVLDLESAQPGCMDTVMAYDVVDGQRREVTSADPMGLVSAMCRRVMAQGAELILRKPEEPPPTDTLRIGDISRLSASIMRVPVHAKSRVVGVLSIQSYTPDAYTREDLQMLQALADHCGGALDRLRIEAALRESERRYSDMLGTVDLIAMALDRDARVTFCNDYLLRLTGWRREEVLGANWFELFIPAGTDELKATFVSLLNDLPTAWHNENELLTRSGERRLVRWNNTVLRSTSGEVIGTASIGEDITERKSLEVQLRQAQKMEAVGQLAGGVAHDFNNMLAVIRGNAELLLMDVEQYPAEARDSLKQVVEASERAANLTRQLLAFSRKQAMQSQPLVLNEVITNLTKMLSRVIGEHIDLQCRYAAPLPHVQADPGMMEQVILNLVVNARDAMPAGGQLRVATAHSQLDEAHARVNPDARAGDFVCLSVSDTGTGIAPENLTRIFEPFFTTKEAGKGTGLGLATVYGIVQQHQGWVEVSSQVGEGTTFKVFLPAIPAPAQSAAASEAAAEVRGGTETILLVEDEHSVRITARRVLEGNGYAVREATNGREALEVWQSYAGEIALLLTDIIMPGEMSGRDLAERLWAQKPGLKVIFMSGYSADVLGKNTEFIRRTKSHFLQKPCSSRVILETVRQCLDEKEAGSRAR